MESPSKAQNDLENIEKQIEYLESVAGDNAQARHDLRRLHQQVDSLREQLQASFSAWQSTEMARHPQRPYTLDYVQHMFTDWSELHGDRLFGEDPALICGMARFQGEEVLVIGHQKGRDVKQRVYRNFGQANP